MSVSTKSSAVQAITALINANGPAYPAKHPSELLDTLTQGLGDDPLVGALYYSCLCGIFKEAAKKSVRLEGLTEEIQTRCAFKKAYAGELAAILKEAYSADNLDRLKKAKGTAFEDLCDSAGWAYVWDGEAEWTCSNGFVECFGHGEAEIRVVAGRSCTVCCRKSFRIWPIVHRKRYRKPSRSSFLRILIGSSKNSARMTITTSRWWKTMISNMT